jgi:uncharacterized protein (DUF305 family)
MKSFIFMDQRNLQSVIRVLVAATTLGMLTAKQLDALRKAKGKGFDHLFLSGMIQHHNGALVMVKGLFDTAGAGQDAELFNFATDVDSGQRAEI